MDFGGDAEYVRPTTLPWTIKQIINTTSQKRLGYTKDYRLPLQSP